MQQGFFARALGLSLVFLAGACTTADLDRLETTQATGSDYSRALTQEYLEFARYEADAMKDWPDSQHFARKGLVTAKGEPAWPERTTNWDLAAGDAHRLEYARRRLAAALAAGADEDLPALSARAQAAFDCWVEQLEERWQADHIEACHDDFQNAITAVERRLGAPRSVYFDHDSASLDTDSTAELQDLAGKATVLSVPFVSVIGHADRSGPADYNLTLSLKRADAAREVLLAAGIPADQIALSAAGETRPRRGTPDGVRDPENRRVEVIFLGYNPAKPL